MATIKKQLSAANGDLYINRWLIGLYTQRSPLFVPVSALGVQIIARHDSLWDGLNMEISTVMSLVRRFGYSRYCSQAFGSSDYPLGFYSNQHLDGTIYPMVDTPTHVCTFTSSTLTPVFAKAESLASPPYPGAQGSFAKVADTLYYCNGNDANLKKWDGTTVTGWGIQPPAAAPTLTFGAGAGAILSSSLDVAGSGYATNDTGTVNGGTFAATTHPFSSQGDQPVTLRTAILTLVLASAGSPAAAQDFFVPPSGFTVENPVLRHIWAMGMDSSEAPALAQVVLDSIGPRLTWRIRPRRLKSSRQASKSSTWFVPSCVAVKLAPLVAPASARPLSSRN
jgi:hypothetical protein